MCGRDAHIDGDAHPGAERCPAIITTAAAPAHPRRSPFIARYPRPTVIVGIGPTSVVKRSPAPIVIRNPGIAIRGHYPMAAGSIGLEITIYVRKPNISVFGVVYPFPIR